MEDMERFFSSQNLCVCVDYGLVMEIKQHNLQPAVCCDTPISFDSLESAIQIWDANVNEPCVLMTSHFHSPHPNQSFPLRLWPRYRQIGLINLIPKSVDRGALLHILKYSGEEESGRKKNKKNWRAIYLICYLVQLLNARRSRVIR